MELNVRPAAQQPIRLGSSASRAVFYSVGRARRNLPHSSAIAGGAGWSVMTFWSFPSDSSFLPSAGVSASAPKEEPSEFAPSSSSNSAPFLSSMEASGSLRRALRTVDTTSTACEASKEDGRREAAEGSRSTNHSVRGPSRGRPSRPRTPATKRCKAVQSLSTLTVSADSQASRSSCSTASLMGVRKNSLRPSSAFVFWHCDRVPCKASTCFRHNLKPSSSFFSVPFSSVMSSSRGLSADV
mmetsp:Transcript_61361/g.138472  ORF Transcript_61361/g.138472 Transcript_61361/m.138472 type:complete len:241 (-) Transcript_61361:3724-4446(-)